MTFDDQLNFIIPNNVIGEGVTAGDNGGGGGRDEVEAIKN